VITRLAKFSAVGAIGVTVQIAVLWALTRMGIPYLPATGAAVEAAVLHNFLWHQRFTWRDRSARQQTINRLLRFHLSNGAVSFIGNLLLMRLLVGFLGLSIIPANLLGIGTCALVNFLLSDSWVFLSSEKA